MKRMALALGTVALLALSAGTALADPIRAPNTTMVTATCGEDDFRMVVIGNGGFTAAHDVGSTKVFVPVWFSATTVTKDNVVDAVYPETSKGSAAPKGHALLVCTWVADAVVFEGHIYISSGTVKGYLT